MPTVIEVDTRAATDWMATLLGAEAEITDPSQPIAWLRVPSGNARTEALIAAIPGARFEQWEGGWLVRPGDKIATRRLDASLVWRRLDDVLDVQLPLASLAATWDRRHRIELRLQRGGEPRQPDGAIVPLQSLCQWAHSASDVRLRRLRWVFSGHQALVLGQPLPPVTCVAMVAHERVLIPAGWQWVPRISASEVRSVFGVDPMQWIVWQQDGRWSLVGDDDFAAMRRASLRRTPERIESESAS